MKTKSMYICNVCGYQTPKWLGKCPGCAGWGTLQETVVAEEKNPIKKATTATKSRKARKIGEISYDEEVRIPTGSGELDRVLGGGLCKGSLVLVGGDPGIGKSTLLLQICKFMGESKKILYISGEESEKQIKLRGERLGVAGDNFYIIS